MKKINNPWINGIFKAWEMMFCFPVANLFDRVLAFDNRNLRSVHILCGFLLAAFAAGFLLVVLSSLLVLLTGTVPGAVAGAFGITLLWVWSDRGAGISVFCNALSRKIQGESFNGMLETLESRPERMASGIASTLFAVIVLLKIVILYFILASQNYSLLILILLSGAFAQAFALNIYTGGNSQFGFDTLRDKKIFYILAVILLLIASKCNLPVALAFGGGSILWNFNVKEHLIMLRGGKSDEAVTFYGECAVLIAVFIAFVYSAGSFAAR